MNKKQNEVQNKTKQESKTKNEVAKKPRMDVCLEELDPEVAAMFEDDVSQDFENLDQEDLTLPRINLTAGTSKLVTDGDCGIGLWFSNIDNELYTKKIEDEIVVLVIKYFKTRVMFHPQSSSKTGIKCKSENMLDGEGNPGGSCSSCSLKNWKADEDVKDGESNKPECSEVHNFVLLLPEFEGSKRVAIMSMKSKAAITGKRWIQHALSLGAGRLYTKAYRIGVKKEKNNKNAWAIPELRKWDKLNRLDLSILKAMSNKTPVEINELMNECKNISNLVTTMRDAKNFSALGDDVNEEEMQQAEAWGEDFDDYDGE